METTPNRGFGMTLVCGLIVAYDVASAAWTAANVGAVRAAVPMLPVWAIWASVAAGLVRATGAVGVLVFRRWGFPLVCLGAVARVTLGFVFVGGFDAVYSAFMSLLVVAVLFGMLAKGGEGSALSRMR